MEDRSNEELFVFADESSFDQTQNNGYSWKVLVVDDEEEVHKLTELVLKDFTFEKSPLEFFHAYSGNEALEVLTSEMDIAVVLLDVVMETDDAGLACVKEIREKLENKDVRIILRTGQPGQAPEQEVISNYDINDYKSKTELTVQKMFTVITASLRTYKFIKTIEKNRIGLENIIEASSHLFGMHSFKLFAQGILEQLTSILQLEDKSIFVNSSGMSAFQDRGDSDYSVLAATGEFSGKESLPLEEIVGKDTFSRIRSISKERLSRLDGNTYTGYLDSNNGEHSILFLQWQRELSNIEKKLVSIFGSNIAIAFENISLNKEIVETQKEVIFTLTEVVEGRSKETADHIRRVAAVSELLAKKLNFSDVETEIIRMAAPMHDIGKVATPDAILNKPGKLTESEYEIMKNHASLGHHILSSSRHELMMAAAIIAYEHHEKWDGTGYPRKLKGNDIHIYGRIVSLADVVDALKNRRCYKDAFELDEVINIIKSERGKHFDPLIVDVFLDSLDEYDRIIKTYPN